MIERYAARVSERMPSLRSKARESAHDSSHYRHASLRAGVDINTIRAGWAMSP